MYTGPMKFRGVCPADNLSNLETLWKVRKIIKKQEPAWGVPGNSQKNRSLLEAAGFFVIFQEPAWGCWIFGGFLVPEMRRAKKSIRREMVEKGSLLEAAGFSALL